MAKVLLALHPAAMQHRCWLVQAECLSLALGKSLARREGLFCRSHSILPRYQNSHLFPLCQFSRSHHVRMSKRGCRTDFHPPSPPGPVVYKGTACHHCPPGWPPRQPHHPRRWAGEQILDFLPPATLGASSQVSPGRGSQAQQMAAQISPCSWVERQEVCCSPL